MKTFKRQQGLTLIEKMVALTFASIVIVVTIPAIIAFTGRPQVIEGHTLMRPIQGKVNAFLQENGSCPKGDLTALGINKTFGKFVADIELNDQCVITATYRDDAREKIAGKTLSWYAGADSEGNIHWSCGTAIPTVLGENPRIAYGAGPESTTANYAPWLPTKCHPPRAMDERKPAVVVLLTKGYFDLD